MKSFSSYEISWAVAIVTSHTYFFSDYCNTKRKKQHILRCPSSPWNSNESSSVYRYMSANNIGFPSPSLFFKYQLQMFCAIVLLVWLEEQWHALELAKRHKKLIIGGDARCDCKLSCRWSLSFFLHLLKQK